ncbi:GLPGLI family protein [Flavobacterium chilense]|uniref:GLPGLI family protein n=1 Tax=Flavobacterium chilense TaxID=946677 RepID=A0A1M7DZF4_9FLAO|nr:GLPGLI family protein [Flavobacterium chilense]SHL84891.1 GLPGLI family protein [Flavobacterium chilense]
MKKLTVIYFSLFSFLGLAQYKKNSVAVIEYSYNVTFDDTYYGKVILKCLNDKSISKTLAEIIPDEKDMDPQKPTVYEKPIDLYQAIDLNKKKLIMIDRIFNTKYKVTEDLSEIKWKLSKEKETKIINKFVCNKATLNFRGRNYTAWYTPYIALPFGPWKFYGLPGLILEMYDTDNNYHWTATKIIYPSNEEFDLSELENQKVKETITLRQFVEKTEEKEKQFMANIRYAAGRHTTVDFGDFEKRKTPELKYEWEIEKKK